MNLRTGDWMMSRRQHDYKTTGVHFRGGSVKSLGDWQSFPVLGSASEVKAEEPDWWALPDQTLAAVFRDNRRSGFLYRVFSNDDERIQLISSRNHYVFNLAWFKALPAGP